MAVPTAGVLTSLLNSFEATFVSGFGHTQGWAQTLLGTLAILELSTAAIWWALSDDNALIPFLRKVMLIGLFIYFVNDYQIILNYVIDGFIETGLGGVSSTTLTPATFANPSAIVSMGITAAQPIFNYIGSLSVIHLATMLTMGIVGLIIIACFFFLAIQIFITYLEFTIISALALILIPFGVFRYTAFISEKAFGAIISFGVKLMVLAFIAAAALPAISAWSLPASPTFQQDLFLLSAALAVAMLAWQAPGVAAGLLAGGPSLTAGTAVGAAAGAAAASMMAGSTLRAAGSATKAAAGGLAHAYGALTTGARLGAAAATGGGVSRAGGALTGAARAAGAVAVSPITSSLGRSYNAGRVSAFRATGGTPPDSMVQASTSGGSPGRGGPQWARHLRTAVAAARSAVPPDARPQAGMSAPIPKET